MQNSKANDVPTRPPLDRAMTEPLMQLPSGHDVENMEDPFDDVPDEKAKPVRIYLNRSRTAIIVYYRRSLGTWLHVGMGAYCVATCTAFVRWGEFKGGRHSCMHIRTGRLAVHVHNNQMRCKRVSMDITGRRIAGNNMIRPTSHPGEMGKENRLNAGEEQVGKGGGGRCVLECTWYRF